MKATAAELKVLKLITEKARELEELVHDFDERITKARLVVLKKGCAHPEEAHVLVTWEWDDGYGTQRKKEGVRCQICNKTNHWPGQSQIWLDEKECG